MKELLRQKAAKMAEVLAVMSGDTKSFAGPFTDLLQQLLEQLLPVLLGCFATPKEAVRAGAELNLGERLRLNMEIRRFFRGEELMTPARVRMFSDAAHEAWKSTNENEMKIVYGLAA